MRLIELLGPDRVFLRGGVSSKRQALHLVASLAASRLGPPAGVDEAGLFDALNARETLGSTGLGGGVALPHVRIDGLAGIAGVFIRLDAPVAWDAVDDRPVDLLFALFASPRQGAEHLRALAAVSRALREPAMRQALRIAKGVDGVHATLVRTDAVEAA